MEIEVLILTENYLNKFKVTFCEYELKEEEKKTLRLLTQLDLLIIEQYYLDKFNPTFNLNKYTGTKLGTITSDEVKSLISESNTGINHYSRKNKSLSPEVWMAIRAAAILSWKNEGKDSLRREDISKVHGKPIDLLNSNKVLIDRFNSILKVSEYLGCNRKTVYKY